MRFQMPESLEGLSIDQLAELHKAAFEEYAGLATKDDAEVTDADLADLEALAGHMDALDEAKTGLETAAAERADKLAAARNRVTEGSTPVEDPDADGNEEEVSTEEIEIPEEDTQPEDAEAEKEKELVTASAARGAVRKAASRAPKTDETPEEPDAPTGSVIIAGANLPSVVAGSEFADLTAAAKAFGARAAKGPAAGSKFQIENGAQYGLSDSHTRLGFAQIRKPEMEFAARSGMTMAEQLDLIDQAGKESRLAQPLTAGGGWCSPSETVYGFCSFETVSGILDIPTIDMSRGGLSFSKGPDYATIAASFGFTQTEAQAEANTPKTCYAVECPPFEEVRLDAVGFCITAGVLTNATYPELIRRVLEIGAVAHAHKMNAYVIGKISTLIGTAVDFAEVGVATADLLDALNLAAERTRYTYSMAPGATLEVVLPVWVKRIIQSDLSRRNGVDMLAIGDAEINRYFAARQVRVQWVYDYQDLTSTSTSTWTTWPSTLEFMMYPAGAFVKGALDVIDMDTIYDSVGLSTNTYTAAFFEEGAAVFNRCAGGVKYSVDISALTGQTGAANIGAAAA